MSILKNIFSKKESTISSYEDFWRWFLKHESTFFATVKSSKNVQEDFLAALMPKLQQLSAEIYPLTGMLNENTAELIFTAEGVVKTIPFIEELVHKSPRVAGWKFTALKPPLDIEDITIEMDGCRFNKEKISFYANEDSAYPDKIDITVSHEDLNDNNRSIISNGIYIYLDHLLGELNFATTIDTVRVVRKDEAEHELIPIEKLNAFVAWREKEFIEKYDGYRHDTENDAHASYEAKFDGKVMLAVANTDLLKWHGKVSHPWILVISFEYDGNENGLPNKEIYEKLNEIEIQLMVQLRDSDGYLNVGRQTGNDTRELYFACRDFRIPSIAAADAAQRYYNDFKISYEIFKDKYWEFFDRFATD